MVYDVSTISVFGEKEDVFSYAHVFPTKNTPPEKGTLYIVFSATKNGKQKDHLIKDVLTHLYLQYYKNKSLTAFNALKKSLQIVSEEVHEVVDISAVAVCENTIYAASCKGGEVGIYRDGGFSKILESESDVVTASGHSKEGDILVFGNKKFFASITNVDLVLALEKKQHNEYINSISRNNKDSGVWLLDFGGNSIVEKENSEKVTNVFSNEKSKKWRGFKLSFPLLKKLRSRPMSLKSSDVSYEESLAQKKQKRTMLSIGILILVMLATSMGFGFYTIQEEEKLASYQPQLDEAEHNYDEAIKLAEISPERAREHFQMSRQAVDALLAQNLEDERIVKLDDDLNTWRESILGEYRVTAQTYHDLSILADGFSGTQSASDGGEMYVLDKETRRALSVTFETKGSEVFAGPGSIDSTVRSIAAFAGRVYVMTDTKIVRIDSERNELVDDTWSGNTLFTAYGGNFYVLEKDTSRIIRYSATPQGFSEGNDWLVDGAEPDLSKINSWAIDGSIWMVSETGGVFKFSLGNQVNFDIVGLTPELLKPTKIFTTEEYENLYVLEPSKERIVVLDKDGNFVAQYVAPELGEALDFAVSEEEKLLLFLVGEKLMSIPLEHL